MVGSGQHESNDGSDALARMLPKASFSERLETELGLARAGGRPLSLLVVDIDYFKSINDAFGHARGDEILAEFAVRLISAVRATDIVVRYGGDEFVVILPNAGKHEALLIGRRLLDSVGQTPFAGSPPLSLTLSIGVATTPDDASAADELFKRADALAYDAKRRGRGQVVGELDEQEQRPRLQSLSRAIDRDTQLNAVYEYLGALPAARRGCFSIVGSLGSGRTRLLADAEAAARLLGYHVVSVRGTPALRGRMHGSLLEAFPELGHAIRTGPATVAAVLADRLQKENRSVLLVAIDDFLQIDEASRQFLKQLVADEQIEAVGVICASEWPLAEVGFSFDAPLDRRVDLSPLTINGLRSWIRAALQWEPPPEFLAWLHRETGGFPERIHQGLSRLLELCILFSTESGWEVDPNFCQLSLGVWLDSNGRSTSPTLPSLLSSIIGRDEEIRAVKSALRTERLITLLGPGGFGKTRLAVQIAAELAEELEYEVCFVALAPLATPESVVPAIAEALRISLHASREPRQQLLEKLKNRQMLLVLDNFEHLVAAAPFVSEILAEAPRVRVLVTSREGLGLRGETTYSVGGLSLPDSDEVDSVGHAPATQLFVQQAERHNLDFRLSSGNAAQIAEICRSLEGGPLAIEIAASLVRILDCGQILAEVRRDLDSLASTSRETVSRHRSLRAVFDYSWNLLSETEQRVWARLSVFHGGFRREAAEPVAGATLPMLVVLANKSLLRRTEDGRFEVHETLRRYADEKLRAVPSEQRETGLKFARFFADFVYARGERGPHVDVARAKTETAEEIENIRASFRWSIEEGCLDEAERCGKGLFRFYDVYGWFAEGEESFRWAVDRVADARLRALFQARRGFFLVKLGDFDAARHVHRQSLKTLQRLGRVEEGALSLFSLAQIATHRGDYQGATRACKKAMRIFREAHSAYGVALCMNELGVLASRRGAHGEAEQRFRRSLDLRRGIKDLPGQARCLNNLAMIAEMQGRSGEARCLFEQSLAVSRQSGDLQSVGNALNNLGVLIQSAGIEKKSRQVLMEARRFFEEALEVYQEIGADASVALALNNLGEVAFHLDDNRAAEDHFREALRRCVANESLPMLCTVFVGVAALLARRGDDTGAARLLSLVEAQPSAPEEDRKRIGQLWSAVATRLSAAELGAVRETSESGSPKDVALELVNGRSFGGSNPGAEALAGYLPFAADVPATIEEGQLAERNARHAAARLCYEIALHSLRTPEDGGLAASLLRWIGRTYVAEGDLGTAEDCLEASLAAAEAHGSLADAAHAVNLQGIVQFYRGDLQVAVLLYQRARATAEAAGEVKLMAMLDMNLGVIANTQGDLEGALLHYQGGLAGFRTLDMQENIIEVLNNLGMLFADLERWADAQRSYEEGLHLIDRMGNLKMKLVLTGNLVEMWIGRKDYDTARRVCDEAFDLASKVGDARTLGELHKYYGVIYRHTHHLHLAETHLSRAERIASEQENLLLAAETAREQSEIFWRQQRHRETLQALNRAHRFFTQLQARRDLAATDRRIADLEHLFLDIVRRWGESIESADQYTQGHCERVADLACALAQATGMDDKTLLWFRMGALLHDVGKIVVPLEVLNKPGKLTPEERDVIERHPDAGVELLAGIEFPWDIRPMVRHHHERWEGGGYPTGIAGEEIPHSARILCIADVYDALTSDRPYRPGFTHEKAIDIMENGMRGHFDPDLFEIFKRIAAAAAADAIWVGEGATPQAPVLQVA